MMRFIFIILFTLGFSIVAKKIPSLIPRLMIALVLQVVIMSAGVQIVPHQTIIAVQHMMMVAVRHILVMANFF